MVACQAPSPAPRSATTGAAQCRSSQTAAVFDGEVFWEYAGDPHTSRAGRCFIAPLSCMHLTGQPTPAVFAQYLAQYLAQAIPHSVEACRRPPLIALTVALDSPAFDSAVPSYCAILFLNSLAPPLDPAASARATPQIVPYPLTAIRLLARRGREMKN